MSLLTAVQELGVPEADGDPGEPRTSQQMMAAFEKLGVGDVEGVNPVRIPAASDMIVAYSTVKGQALS